MRLGHTEQTRGGTVHVRDQCVPEDCCVRKLSCCHSSPSKPFGLGVELKRGRMAHLPIWVATKRQRLWYAFLGG